MRSEGPSRSCQRNPCRPGPSARKWASTSLSIFGDLCSCVFGIGGRFFDRPEQGFSSVERVFRMAGRSAHCLLPSALCSIPPPIGGALAVLSRPLHCSVALQIVRIDGPLLSSALLDHQPIWLPISAASMSPPAVSATRALKSGSRPSAIPRPFQRAVAARLSPCVTPRYATPTALPAA